MSDCKKKKIDKNEAAILVQQSHFKKPGNFKL